MMGLCKQGLHFHSKSLDSLKFLISALALVHIYYPENGEMTKIKIH